MVGNSAGKHKKAKTINFDTAALAAFVNEGTRYWAFTYLPFTSYLCNIVK